MSISLVQVFSIIVLVSIHNFIFKDDKKELASLMINKIRGPTPTLGKGQRKGKGMKRNFPGESSEDDEETQAPLPVRICSDSIDCVSSLECFAIFYFDNKIIILKYSLNV